MSTRMIEEGHGFAGARRVSGGLGGQSRPPIQSIEEGHGFAGARRALGGVGGHIGAPHVNG